MDIFALRFVKGALVYGLVGVVIGLYMITGPSIKYALVFAHAHIMLFGFVGMIIYGVAYHILPRFRGKPLHSSRLANWHVLLANVGLVGMAIFWAVNSLWASAAAKGGLVFFGTVAVVSFAMFVYNIWKTIR